MIKLKLQPITTINYDGKTYPVVVSILGNKNLEQRFAKPLPDILQQQSPDVVIALLSEAIKSGLRKEKRSIEVDAITDDFVAELIDDQPSLYGDILHTYSVATQKYFRIQEEGKEAASPSEA